MLIYQQALNMAREVTVLTSISNRTPEQEATKVRNTKVLQAAMPQLRLSGLDLREIEGALKASK